MAQTTEKTAPEEAKKAEPPVSVFRKRLKKFRSLKRGYYSFLILTTAYILSFFLPFLMHSKALVVSYNGELHFPMMTFYQGKAFDQEYEQNLFGEGEPNYRLLKERCDRDGKGNWVLMPLIRPYDPLESPRLQWERTVIESYKKGDFSIDKPGEVEVDDEPGYSGDDDDEAYSGDDDDESYAGDDDDGDTYAGDDEEIDVDDDEKERARLLAMTPPLRPSKEQWFGSDDRGRDLLVRLCYGFRVSITFALVLLFFAYTIGITVGAVLGYYGGMVDLLGQRVVEVWQTVPFLFTVMILGAALADALPYLPQRWPIFQPRFFMLAGILAIFSWMGMSYYVRGEFLREKSRDYVSAAISIGTPDSTIIFKHVLPNALTPVVTFAPFAIVGYISSLVALDYLGFGLPAPIPSWGELMKQALPEHINSWWLVGAPIGALFVTLLLVVFIGEAIREAFDPKIFSRLR